MDLEVGQTFNHQILTSGILSIRDVFRIPPILAPKFWLFSQNVPTLRFLINILDQISVLVGNFIKANKCAGPNKHTSAKLLAPKRYFL